MKKQIWKKVEGPNPLEKIEVNSSGQIKSLIKKKFYIQSSYGNYFTGLGGVYMMSPDILEAEFFDTLEEAETVMNEHFIGGELKAKILTNMRP